MFIELIKPKVITIHFTRDRVKIVLREPDAPGRIWVNFTYENLEEAKRAVKGIMEELEKGPPDPMKSLG